jgi:hypothetical protein
MINPLAIASLEEAPERLVVEHPLRRRALALR